ncbi:MAG: hypothetical protein WC197_08680 [Candidatus Gastranaerophilaceae bacterium]|jgi:hypothetical protein
MLKAVRKKSKQKQLETRAYTTNPINAVPKDDELLNRIENSVISYMNFLDNPKVDNILKKEFGKNCPELSLIVKEHLINSRF